MFSNRTFCASDNVNVVSYLFDSEQFSVICVCQSIDSIWTALRMTEYQYVTKNLMNETMECLIQSEWNLWVLVKQHVK